MFQAKIRKESCWSKIEKFVGEKFPDCLKLLLSKAGYDRLNSLNKIDAARISEIEAHLDYNRDWINELKCCNSEYYKQLSSFRFLPGHKATILDIPDQIQQMCGAVGGLKSLTVGHSSKNQRSNEEIIQGLVSNMLKYTEKINFPLTDDIISLNNVNDFERGSEFDDFAYKCRFACPFCDRVFPLKYKTFWMSSNLTKHLKNHISFEMVEDMVEDDAT